MHEDFGSHAGREPDAAPRAYRLDVLLDGVTETAGLALMHGIADLLVEAGLASPEAGDVRAMVGLRPHTWAEQPAEAWHVLVPRAVPQSPDLGANYSPNEPRRVLDGRRTKKTPGSPGFSLVPLRGFEPRFPP